MSVNVSIDGLMDKTFNNFKKVTPALLSIAVLTGFVLFLPEKILKKMALNDLPDVWNRIIGIVFLLSVTLIIIITISIVFSVVVSKIKYKKFKENQKKKLEKLSSRQKNIIIDMLHSEEKTIYLDKNSGDTIFLLNNLLIHQPEQVFTLGCNNEMILIYAPQPWLLDLYNEEPELFRK